MTNPTTRNLLAMSILSALLLGCGNAETTINELESIVVPDTETDDHTSGDTDGDYIINSLGRLAVTSTQSNNISLLDIDDGSLLDNFALKYDGTSISASANNRYVVLNSRNFDTVQFLDAGLWREDHVAHIHDYQQAPSMSDFELSGIKPTHLSAHEGNLAVFYDGDSEAGLPAAIHLVSDNDINSQTTVPTFLEYPVNMHGVALPRGEFVIATIRREDSDNTSNNNTLPDQVAVHHIHDEELELEQVIDMACPDLHGAAQNHEFLAFGFSDGVMVIHDHDGEFEAHKIPNIEAINKVRIGTIYGHENSELLVGIASTHGSGAATVLTITPEENEMELLDWQGLENANPVSYSFTYDGAHFVILDDQGYVTILAVEQHEGHTHLEFENRLSVTELDVATMPEGTSFGMAVSKNDNHIYVSDPMSQHILQIDIETMSIEGDMELDFIPAAIVWLGIAAEDHDNGHH